MMNYDIVIIGAGPGGIFLRMSWVKLKDNLKIGIFEAGRQPEKRKCPIDGERLSPVSAVKAVRS